MAILGEKRLNYLLSGKGMIRRQECEQLGLSFPPKRGWRKVLRKRKEEIVKVKDEFLPRDRKKTRDAKGIVYRLIYQGEIMYVGVSGSKGRPFASVEERFPLGKRDKVSVEVVFCRNLSEAKVLEVFLIERWKPRLNKTCCESHGEMRLDLRLKLNWVPIQHPDVH